MFTKAASCASRASPTRPPGPARCSSSCKAAALNRRDLLVCNGTYPFPLPLVPGSDGAGVRRDTGEEVVIYPSLRWGHRGGGSGA